MRALLLILDGVGVENPQASMVGTKIANPIGRFLRHPLPFELPNFLSLGLREILTGKNISSIPVRACYGRIKAASHGKELISAHWEIAGVNIKEPFTQSTRFPAALLKAIETEAKVALIGNCSGKGSDILEKFGEIHLKSKRPILYTSSHSVIQIAAHEKVIPRRRLYEICRIARRYCYAFRIARVIARPFTGSPGNFIRPENGRLEFPILPPRTVLNALSEAGLAVECVGKIAYAFGASGITGTHHATSNQEALKTINERWGSLHNGLILANLSDFDTTNGPRQNPSGFAKSLIEFDDWLGHFLPQIDPDDLVIITATHGHDPLFRGHNEDRDDLTLFAISGGKQGPLKGNETFADITATLLEYFELDEKWPFGKSLFSFKRPPLFYY